MSQTTWLQDRRMAKFADVLSRWQIKQLSAAEAGEILGMSERTFRRFRHRYEDEGEAGLADKRVGCPSHLQPRAGKVTLLTGRGVTLSSGLYSTTMSYKNDYVK